MNRVSLRFMNEVVGQPHASQHFVVAVPELLNAPESLAISQADCGNRFVKRFHRQAVIFGELFPNLVERHCRLIEPVMHRVDAARRVYGPGCLGRRFSRTAADVVVAFSRNNFQSHVQRVATVVREHQRQIEMQVLKEERLMTKLFCRHCPRQLQVTGRREHNFPIHLMIVEVRKLLHVECRVPDGHSLFRHHLRLTFQERMLESAASHFFRLRRFEPVPAVLPRRRRQPNEPSVGTEQFLNVRFESSRRQSCQAL